MTVAVQTPLAERTSPRAVRLATIGITAVLFVALFYQQAATLARDWWTSPEAGHGLLLAPLACWLAWKRGIRPGAAPNMAVGLAIIVSGVILRYVGGLAAELFTLRASMLITLAGLLVFELGVRQLLFWWLPVTLIALAVPLPEVVLSGLALPLQFKASQLGTALLELRHVPVRLDGNVILLPGHRLFVTEACSGLRSLTALLSLGVLLGGTVLRHPLSRVLLLLLALPVAVVVNGVRVFLTGFLVLFVDPKLGDGFSHMTEGLLLFLVSFAALGVIAGGVRWVEARLSRRTADA